MTWGNAAPWLAPLLAAIITILIPKVIEKAIDGKFAEFRFEESERMKAHNDDVHAHPSALDKLEEKIEAAMEKLKKELLQEIAKLSAQIAGTQRAKGKRS